MGQASGPITSAIQARMVLAGGNLSSVSGVMKRASDQLIPMYSRVRLVSS